MSLSLQVTMCIDAWFCALAGEYALEVVVEAE